MKTKQKLRERERNKNKLKLYKQTLNKSRDKLLKNKQQGIFTALLVLLLLLHKYFDFF